MDMGKILWLEWARALQAISQTGLHYTDNRYDRDAQGHTPRLPYHVYKLFFLCKITGGSARANHEASEIAFFAEDDFPELSTSRVTEKQLNRFFKHSQDLNLPTDFD
jgi:hypothetical protein